MAKSFIGGEEIPKEEPQDRHVVKDIHIGVFFEGSGLNMANEVFYKSFFIFRLTKRKELMPVDEITPDTLCTIEKEEGTDNGFTNVSMLFTLFNGKQFGGDIPNKKIYIEGAGTTEISHDFSVKYGIGGFAFGNGETGVTALVSKAVRKVTEYVSSVSEANPEETKLHFYVFGFSRGATCSRLFCHLLTRDTGSILKCEEQFGEYGAKTLVKNGRLEFLEEYKANDDKITVEFLGLYDTVASIGILKRKDGSQTLPFADGPWHYNNVEEYGLYINQDVTKVKSVCHLCAMDEFRENFALVNLGKNVPANAVEIMIPGCHSDVGGSYLEDTHASLIRKGGLIHNKRKISFSPYNAIPTDTDYVSLASFKKLGWIGQNETKSTENYSEVELVRKINRGYSDIPLSMMMEYCHGETGITLFNPVPVFHDYLKCGDDCLENFGNEMVAKMGGVKGGNRYWFFPTNYTSLRLKYLQFSSKDYLCNVGELSFLGSNSPNYNEDNVMCRITYHGDAGEHKSAAEGVHFLYELYERSDTVKNIEFDDNDDKNTTAGKTNPYVGKNHLMCSAGKNPKVSI